MKFNKILPNPGIIEGWIGGWNIQRRTKMNTPKAVLTGLTFIAIAIASVPISSHLVRIAHAELDIDDYQMIDNGIAKIVLAINGIEGCGN